MSSASYRDREREGGRWMMNVIWILERGGDECLLDPTATEGYGDEFGS